MEPICKRLFAALLAAALLFTVPVFASAAGNETDAKVAAVEWLIYDIAKEKTVFNSCDSIQNGLVFNCNNGGDTMELAEGQGMDGGNAVKFSKKAGGATEHNEAFRNDGIEIGDYTAVEFSLYLSEGLTVTPSWSPLCIQSEAATNSDNGKFVDYNMSDLLGSLTVGQWNRVTVDISAYSGVAKQIALRFYNVFSGEAGQYIMVDNILLSKPTAVTYKDKAAVDAAKAAYDALTDEQKALVSNADLLNQYVAYMAGYDTAPQAVIKAIEALQTEGVDFNNCDSIAGDAVFNCNNGGDTMELAEGQGVDGGNAVKFTKKAGGATEHNEAFRHAGFDVTDALSVEFDLYLSEGITVTPSWSPLTVQSETAANSDNGKFIDINMQELLGDLQAGQWNHMSVGIAGYTGIAKQISLRFYNVFSGQAGEYIMVDNIQITKPNEITAEDKAAVEAVKAEYDKLDAAQQALVTNYSVLENMLTILDGTDEQSMAVVEAINALSVTSTPFNNCDAQYNADNNEIIANINSGALSFSIETENVAEGAGAAKYTYINDSAPDLPLMVRSGGINLTDYEALEFDLYLSEGLSFSDAAASFGDVRFQTNWTNSQDSGATVVPATAVYRTLKPGWNHVKIDCSTIKTTITQITLRFYNMLAGSAGDYIMLDNVRVSKSKEVTYADKQAIQAVAAAYAALTDIQKTAVSNYAVLEGYLAIINRVDAAVKAVEDQINALPAAGDIQLEDKPAVEAARTAYEALESVAKSQISETTLQKLKDAEAAIGALEGSGEKAQTVIDMINALPAEDAITLDSADAIAAARAAYDQLETLAQALVTNASVLTAAEEQLARLQAEEQAKADEVIAAIDELAVEKLVFHTCDSLTAGDLDIAANINSGGVRVALETENKLEGTGSIKVSPINNSAPDMPVGLRSAKSVNVKGYEYIEFDMYLSAGMTVASTWGNISFQNAYANTPDGNKVGGIDLLAAVLAMTPGQWNHVKFPLPTSLKLFPDIAQITVRPGNGMLIGDANEYILLDRVVFSKAKTVTYADKAAVYEVKAQYDQLSDYAKALVTNRETLDGYLSALETLAAEGERVSQLIENLPAANQLTLADKTAVEEARTAWDALDEAVRATLNCEAKLTEAEGTIVLLEEAQAVIDQIASLPAVIDLTLEDEAAVGLALDGYNALSEDAKAYVTNYNDLQTAVATIAALKADSEAAKLVTEQIASLPAAETLTLGDEAAVNAAADAYNALSDSAKALVTNHDTLQAALDQIEQLKEVKPGDVNKDGTVNAEDALLVLKIAVNKYQPSDSEKLASDVNKDGVIDAADALDILKFAVGKISSFS